MYVWKTSAWWKWAQIKAYLKHCSLNSLSKPSACYRGSATGCSEKAHICFSVINKPVANLGCPSAGFLLTHVLGQTHVGYIFSSRRYCDPPDIRGPIILLLHLASRETLDRLSWRETVAWWGWKATRVTESRQMASTVQKQPGHSVAVPHCCSHLDSKVMWMQGLISVMS